MANWSNTISCHEVVGTVVERYDDARGYMTASVTLRCAWADRHALVGEIVGERHAWIKGSASVAPLAMTAAIEPVVSPGSPGTAQQEVVYSHANVTINYSTLIADNFTESLEPTAEFVKLPHYLFRWGAGNGDPLREEEAPGKLIRRINLRRTELNIAVIPPATFTLVGHTNSSPYSSPILGRTFGPETLLYAPPVATFKRDSAGVIKFDLTKNFTINEDGWNTYYRGFTGTYQKIHRAGVGTPHNSYPVSDLSPVLATL